MAITAEFTQECGCNVEEVWVDSFKVAGYNILYCPRHAHADADAMSDVACGCHANIHDDIHYTPTDIEFCPRHAAADPMYELLRFDVLSYFEGEWDSVNRHPASRFGDWVKIIKATIALADGDGGE